MSHRSSRPTVPTSEGVDLASLLMQAGPAIVIADAQMRILAVNPAYARLTGSSPREVLGERLQRLLGKGEGPLQGDLAWTHPDGRPRTLWISDDEVRDDAGRVTHHVVTLTDITPVGHELDVLRHLAQHDELTGLPNRRMLVGELERCVARARRHGSGLAVLFIDLNRFKQVNDTLGHAVGDALLQETARRLRASLRAEDLVARWGGDEFVVVLEDLDLPEDVAVVAGTLCEAISRPAAVGGHGLTMTASIGVALYPQHADNSHRLLQWADAAMYRAKRGKGAKPAKPAKPVDWDDRADGADRARRADATRQGRKAQCAAISDPNPCSMP